MSKQNLLAIAISVAISVAASIAANIALERRRESVLPGVLRAKKMELVDANGHVRGTFELVCDGHNAVTPMLIMQDSDGRDMIDMGIDVNGNGVLSFASEHWNEGAVILGHLDLEDAANSRQDKTLGKSGAWGLQIRSPQNRWTGVGFLNTGRPIVPLSLDKGR